MFCLDLSCRASIILVDSDRLRDGPVDGEKIGNYQVESCLGKGGMGTVYKAMDLESGEYVALKVLPPQLSREPNFLLRFRREIDTLKQLDHPGIVQIKSVGEEDGNYYYAMEFVEGRTLEETIETSGKIPVVKAIDIIITV